MFREVPRSHKPAKAVPITEAGDCMELGKDGPKNMVETLAKGHIIPDQHTALTT